MKNLLVIGAAAALLFFPSVSFAASLTPAQVSAVIGLLEAFGVDAQTIAMVQADLEPSAVVSPQVTTVPSVPVVPAVPSSSSYQPVSVETLSSDPMAYVGQQVSVTGMVNALMPSTGAPGSTNYIQIIDPFDPSQPKVQLEVDDSPVYSAAASSLQDKSSPILQFVRAYGTVLTSQAFVMTNLFGSQTVYLPTVNVTRIDKCFHGPMNTTVLTGTTLADNFTCTAWETIAGR